MHLGELGAVQAGNELAGPWSHRHKLLVQRHCLVAPNVPVGRDRVMDLGWLGVEWGERIDGAPRKEAAEGGALPAFLGSARISTSVARRMARGVDNWHL